jgi:hypothetical protein
LLTEQQISDSPARLSYQYRVRYQRRGWTHEQQRIFFSLKKTQAFLDKLTGGEDQDYEPLLFVKLDRRAVPPWQPHKEWMLQ